MDKLVFGKWVSFSVLMFFISLLGLAQQSLQVLSPDGKLKVDLNIEHGAPVYSLQYEDQIFLEESPLGLKTSINDFTGGLRYVSHSEEELEDTYYMAHGKQSEINYQANELTSNFVSSTGDTLQVIFRLSNNDLAFASGIRGGNEQPM